MGGLWFGMDLEGLFYSTEFCLNLLLISSIYSILYLRIKYYPKMSYTMQITLNKKDNLCSIKYFNYYNQKDTIKEYH